MLSVIKVKN